MDVLKQKTNTEKKTKRQKKHTRKKQMKKKNLKINKLIYLTWCNYYKTEEEEEK